MNIKAQIPNMFTMLNLFSGCVALVFVAEFNFELAFYFVCLGIFFDFFDGFFARKFDVAGPLGVQLDSLADMVTSGVVPGFVMFQMMRDNDSFGALSLFPYFGFVITLGACYRLAKFNIDTRQSESFIGLPTPANALFFGSLPLVNASFFDENFNGVVFNNWILIAMCLLSFYVMNAEIPLFSLKIKNFSLAKYKLQIFFLILSIVLLFIFHVLAVPMIILLYVLLSVLNNFFTKKSV
ncbi:MAG: CDP-alcohol phosphatidyltransferase family protein [Bacteroidetes bacterium]|uniref:CDP-alcohol phosphatidyltransferase family protein n=1 Tax=Flavobacterium sp. TaxID=239 RepID=UPI002FD98484|nr:CDP-alcohol phosphatidyltransferase family protein [Bacteroidota bacterium]